jgi:hypothetical protein
MEPWTLTMEAWILKWRLGESVDQWLPIRITLMSSRIRMGIRIKMKKPDPEPQLGEKMDPDTH